MQMVPCQVTPLEAGAPILLLIATAVLFTASPERLQPPFPTPPQPSSLQPMTNMGTKGLPPHSCSKTFHRFRLNLTPDETTCCLGSSPADSCNNHNPVPGLASSEQFSNTLNWIYTREPMSTNIIIWSHLLILA